MTAMTLSALGICCALGNDKQQVWQNMVTAERQGMIWSHHLLLNGEPVVVGEVSAELPSLEQWPPHFRSRNNQLALLAFRQISPQVTAARLRYGAERIAVIIGSSTSGIAEGEQAIAHYLQQQNMPADYHYTTQEMAAPAEFIARAAEVTGPAYVISTACSSSARALLTARTLLLADLADAVIVGGVDSLCKLTLNGFYALESVSSGFCQPFSKHRDGINIGEGAALFLMERQAGDIQFMGGGAASDAYHMSAPHPEGRGAIDAIQQACRQAGIAPSELDYINLHGTATPLNDMMESKALNTLQLNHIPASSTKALTGHTLGAAGAIEAALCWLALSDYNTAGYLPPHCWDGEPDPQMPSLNWVSTGQQGKLRYCLSNSFAFGGNNVAVILGKNA